MSKEITLFTTHCPKCRVLEGKMKEKGLAYNAIDDVEKIRESGIGSVPVLRVDDRDMEFYEAVRYVNSMEAMA